MSGSQFPARPELTPDTSLEIAPDILATALADEVAILAARSGQYYGLNATGGEVWELLEEPRTGREIANVLAVHDQPLDTVLHDVMALLDEMVADSLLVPARARR